MDNERMHTLAQLAFCFAVLFDNVLTKINVNVLIEWKK